MNHKQLDDWWSSLKIEEKERIATKYQSVKIGKTHPTIKYPNCTKLWGLLRLDEKEYIHNHCVQSHGLVTPDFKEGFEMSY